MPKRLCIFGLNGAIQMLLLLLSCTRVVCLHFRHSCSFVYAVCVTWFHPTLDDLDVLCCKGELRATWSVSSTSSEDDHGGPADDADTKPQFSGRKPAYTASRVFYRSDRQTPETSANIGDSSDGDTPEDIRTNKQSRTADNSNTNNNRQPRDRNYYKNSEYLNNKSAKFKSDRAEGGKRADIVDKRENYKHNSQERRNIATKQSRGNATNSGHNDNDKSKQRNETESRNVASLKSGRRESDWAGKERDSATPVDNMRYSSNRRSPRKWKLLPIPATNYRTERSAEPSPSVPFDDRRPYRRNLPPRILAKLKAKSSTSASAAEDAATSATTTTTSDTSCNDDKDSNVEVTQAKADVRNGADRRQNDGKLQAQCMRARNTYLTKRN